MTTPARRIETTPAPISLPPDVKVYMHPLPDGRTCRSAWAQDVCSCGAHALTWGLPAVPWTRSLVPRPIDAAWHPDDPASTSVPASRLWEFVPDNAGIIEILAQAITGPYQFAHDALHPYVTVGPSTDDELMTIHETPRLRLARGAKSRRLTGRQQTMTLAVMLDRSDEYLVEVGPTRMSRVLPPRRPKPAALEPPHPAQLPQSLALAPVISKPPPRRLVVAPVAPPAVDAPIPEILAAVCQAEAVDKDLGDYLVIPTGSVTEAEAKDLPSWVVCSPLVAQIRIVKPRLKVDRPFGGEPLEQRP